MALETVSLDSFCTLLVRSKLLSAEEVGALRQRWLREGGASADDLARFRKWLVTLRYLTEYQAALLSRGHVERFFLNDYKLLDRIGAGGMAGVYKAVHRLGQTVAIKVLPPSKAKDARKFARFQREGHLAMRFKHPNIVRTFQLAKDDGVHYLVMEYLEGETLEEIIKRRGPLPPAEAARLIYQALRGLGYLHKEGIVHRDLKPSNLMLVPPVSNPSCWGKTKADITLGATVKILDIGLGRALFEEVDAPTNVDANVTADGAIFGTADYMSPEQSRDTHSVDVRSDIYSLGCTLFHALAGQPPFPDTNLVRKVVRHATEPVPALKTFNPAVPDGLQEIVNRMMAKDADQRYPTPESVAQALQPFLIANLLDPTLGAGIPSPEMSEVKQVFLEWLTESTSEEETASTRSSPIALPPPAPTVPIAVPVEQPARDVVLVEKVNKKLPQGQLSRRDAIMLSIGAGILLTASVIVWAIQRVLGKKKGKEIQEEEKSEETP
jgi:serine/threonine protein kinase